MPDTKVIREKRGPKETLDPFRPYHILHEEERWPDGRLLRTNTIFLANRECPFTCTMCDLWRHTLPHKKTPAGAIPAQIRYGLQNLPDADVVKLYNNGNFFDTKAIPKNEYTEIAQLCSRFEKVVVENHPLLCGELVSNFASLLKGELQIAMGLETIHPVALARLNKQISEKDIRKAASFLRDYSISMRGFVLFNPPFIIGEEENHFWCTQTAELAFELGFDSVAIIPTRGGNGIMETLQANGDFVPPRFTAFERVFDDIFRSPNKSGCVTADLWDIDRLNKHSEPNFEQRIKRLETMNLSQSWVVAVPENLQN
ncbi:MAG: hypothetical protein LAT67_15175 [Balneolales bacterium]|nr:hypothetical protein [Balneolales bacterium]